MRKTIISLFVVLMLMVSFSTVFSQGIGWQRPGMGVWATANLNLTSDQMQKLQTMQQDYLKEITPIQSELTLKTQELRTLMVNPAANADQIMAKQNEVFNLRQKLQKVALKYRLNARKILTPEQIALLPAGCGLGFVFGGGYGLGAGMGRRAFYRGQGRGMGMGAGMGFGAGRGRGMGAGRGIYCPYRVW